MFDNVMIGIDGEQGGRDAIALARQLVSDEGKLTLVHVHSGFPIVAKGSGANSPFVITERERAEELLAEESRNAGLEASFTSIGSSSIGQGLHQLAERDGADLLVVGSTRRGLFGRVLLGDDTRAALNGAPCSVAVAPAGYAEYAKPLQHVGVAFDDSPESHYALTVARELGAYFGAKLSACDVVAARAYYLGVCGPERGLDDELAEQFEPGLLDGVEFHARYGLPADELGFYSGSVDLLVTGSRGYGPIGRIVHGSTSAQLTRTARCPLLVLVRNGAAETPTGAVDDGEVAIKA
ncbi:MAG TPA: universal stress protein [Solirubrobacteraceae bacterium]|nr:universal stress protein [Solirubrobacteraceae bacterium]